MSDSLLILAHGAGQPSDSPWMESMAAALAELGVRTRRFNFHYMDEAQKTGKSRPPSRLPKLLEEYREVLNSIKDVERVFVGGKSLGGRVASHLAVSEKVSGLVAFGYPFHPPRKLDKLRTAHLPEIECPVLICQGERDPFGKREEVAGYGLSESFQIEWIPDGDHQFKPRKRSGFTLEENIALAARTAAAFVK
jgi:predicted alpha/beta-hydrolase family hydrolase